MILSSSITASTILHTTFVTTQEGITIWTFMFNLVQIVDAAWNTGTTPKSKEAQNSSDNPSHWTGL